MPAEVIIATTKSYVNESPVLSQYKNKIVVIPNGINLDEVTTEYTMEESRNILGLPHDVQIILFFGSLVPYKGPDILLKAFRSIKKEFPKVKLIFAGRGQMHDELCDLSKQFGLENDVVFTGFVKEEEKPLYYKASDIFCLPSTTMAESFGIVNLEAMASGIPIVSTDLGGIPDIVKEGENGLLAKPGDYKSLVNSLLCLLRDNKLKKKLGNNGRSLLKIIVGIKLPRKQSSYIKIYSKTLADL